MIIDLYDKILFFNFNNLFMITNNYHTILLRIIYIINIEIIIHRFLDWIDSRSDQF